MDVKTTTDCVTIAENILLEAEQVTTREEHANMWDRKAELLKIVNDSLEAGAFADDEAYQELKTAQHILLLAERKAGQKARLTYARK